MGKKQIIVVPDANGVVHLHCGGEDLELIVVSSGSPASDPPPQDTGLGPWDKPFFHLAEINSLEPNEIRSRCLRSQLYLRSEEAIVPQEILALKERVERDLKLRVDIIVRRG